MTSIKDKLKAEECNERTVRLWPEGMFFKAYERSAYLFVTQLKDYDVRRRYVDAVGRDVVWIGFPQSVLGKLEFTHATATDGAEVIKLSASVDEHLGSGAFAMHPQMVSGICNPRGIANADITSNCITNAAEQRGK